jgi:hypothetical protein
MVRTLLTFSFAALMGPVACSATGNLGAQNAANEAQLGSSPGEIRVTALSAGSYLNQNGTSNSESCVISVASSPITGEIRSAGIGQPEARYLSARPIWGALRSCWVLMIWLLRKWDRFFGTSRKQSDFALIGVDPASGLAAQGASLIMQTKSITRHSVWQLSLSEGMLLAAIDWACLPGNDMGEMMA